MLLGKITFAQNDQPIECNSSQSDVDFDVYQVLFELSGGTNTQASSSIIFPNAKTAVFSATYALDKPKEIQSKNQLLDWVIYSRLVLLKMQPSGWQ